MLLEVRDIQAGYGDTPALFGISFHVDRGEFVSIVGSNGAGKSTLLRTISGVLKPSSGQILFQDKRIDGRDPAWIAGGCRIAHVPEGRLLFPRLTVLQNLLLGAYTTGRAKHERLLARTFDLLPRLKERQSQMAGTLSGGEQQMLAIGRWLMLDPSLLMLDEPSLGVQPNLVIRIYDAIRAINQQGTTVLLVEQNIRDSLSMADRAYVIQTGKVIAEGIGKELLGSELVRKAYLGL